MLQSLIIKDFVLIKNAEINFELGFTVLTGDTGAGKSIILNAIDLLLGKKKKADLVRYGCDKSIITGQFSSNKFIENILQENDIEVEEELLIKAVLNTNGKYKTYVNDNLVSKKILENLAVNLAKIHGQKEQFFLCLIGFHKMHASYRP